ncbi:protein tramtrack, beta isoform isoform X2 [Cylas formicarius]|uniref:protein tramtrack, beta isoform isoform X2 n=1 Tax=Cylas formicarius TaxID=197179 RepID=UPI002958A300|nr:protein tramtrack, beta isoform isoform X2 [Cylas formicarius]
MDNPVEICENYQLKWSSYTSYIHSCIATSLLTEESYADVALVTMDGHKIMAHRFVLSYASQYLSKALRFHSKVTTALPLMIVLPQEITYKALKILVKYMYSGEATVSKDILNVVLKAGDILKIKGLYRETIEEEQQKQKQKSLITSQVVNPESTQNKPKEKTAETASKSPSQSKEKSAELSKKEGNKGTAKFIMQQKTDKPPPLKVYTRPKVLNFSMNNFNGSLDKENASPKRTIVLNQKLTAQKDKPHTITSAEAAALESPDSSDATDNIKSENSKHGDNLQFLVIKDEPLGWSEADMELIDQKEVFPEPSVKTESYDSTSNDNSNDLYTPLTCELCTETFTIPAEWVRHVQTHTDMLPAKRRRRDSPDEDDENATFPELQCDLCEKSFSTPAEWVRHIQDTHTEFELSLSNRRHPQPSKKVCVRRFR